MLTETLMLMRSSSAAVVPPARRRAERNARQVRGLVASTDARAARNQPRRRRDPVGAGAPRQSVPDVTIETGGAVTMPSGRSSSGRLASKPGWRWPAIPMGGAQFAGDGWVNVACERSLCLQAVRVALPAR